MTRDWEEAIRKGDIEKVRALVEAGADINALDRHGQTALMNASHRGQTELVRFLISRGADLNHVAKFRLSALMLAVIADHPEVVRALTEAGADATLRGSHRSMFNKTAVEIAQQMGRQEIAKILRLSRKSINEEGA